MVIDVTVDIAMTLDYLLVSWFAQISNERFRGNGFTNV